MTEYVDEGPDLVATRRYFRHVTCNGLISPQHLCDGCGEENLFRKLHIHLEHTVHLSQAGTGKLEVYDAIEDATLTNQEVLLCSEKMHDDKQTAELARLDELIGNFLQTPDDAYNVSDEAWELYGDEVYNPRNLAAKAYTSEGSALAQEMTEEDLEMLELNKHVLIAGGKTSQSAASPSVEKRPSTVSKSAEGLYGVLGSSLLIIARPGQRKIQRHTVKTPCTLSGLYAMASHYGVTCLALMPEIQVPCVSDIPGLYAFSVRSESKPEYFTYSRISQVGKANSSVEIFHSAFFDVFGFELQGKPEILMGSLCYLYEALEIPLSATGTMAIELLERMNGHARRLWIEQPKNINLFDLEFKHAARDLHWKKQEITADRFPLYVHQYDKNSSYLAAMTGVSLGAGTLYHEHGSAIDVSLPGIYRITYTARNSAFDGVNLPPVFHQGQEWATPELILQARTLGYHVSVHEAYQYGEKHDTLKSIATYLWNTRESLHPTRGDVKKYPNATCRTNAYGVIKEIAVVLNGRFGSEKYDTYNRPDWWCAVVSRGRSSIEHEISKHIQDAELIATYNDSLYYLSSLRDPDSAVPGLTHKSANLGGYKYEGTWELTSELLELFNSIQDTRRPGKFTNKLKKEASL